jgi:nucleotide-binding universal stress UspA family protein
VIYSLVEEIEQRLDDLKQQALDAGLEDVSIHVRFGNPKSVIAREFPADHANELIVVGTTGLSAVERFMVGSVTSYVNRNAKCDVLIVKIK